MTGSNAPSESQAPAVPGGSLAPFHHPTFVILWIATVVSNVGVWMQNAAAGWLMTTLDQDPFVVSMVQFATTFPMFLFALPAGALADIVDRRRLLILTQAASTCLAGAFGFFVLFGNVSADGLIAFMLLSATAAALVATVDHRGQWARVLPRFSELSLFCVIVLLAAGVAGALVAVDALTELFATGYGRVLLVKIVLTVVLMTLAWRNRARWLPAAKSHRVTAYVSRSRSLFELAIMAVALTMAAALSVTG